VVSTRFDFTHDVDPEKEDLWAFESPLYAHEIWSFTRDDRSTAATGAAWTRIGIF
jgi:hypothetical protein